MAMTEEQFRFYDKNGYLFLPDHLSQPEVEAMKAELPSIFTEDSPRRVLEKEGGSVRSVYGSHVLNPVFGRLTRLSRIVGPAMQIVGGKVYVYQFKINTKSAFAGDLWDWHQDYVFWRNEDGLARPSVANVAVYLHEINEFNGPMFLIPGSHRDGVIEVAAKDEWYGRKENRPKPYQDSPAWVSNLTANLKYSLDKDVVSGLVERYGMVAPKGAAGSVLFFDGNIVHGSPSNISPLDRVVVFITFNSVENIPEGREQQRPEFLVSRDYTPIVPLSDDAALS